MGTLSVVCVAARDRKAYESSAPVHGTPLAVGGSPTRVARYVWLLCMFDIAIMYMSYYGILYGDVIDAEGAMTLWQTYTSCWVHGLIYGLATVHIQLWGRGHEAWGTDKEGRMTRVGWLLTRLFFGIAVLCSSSIMSYVFGYQPLAQLFGWGFVPRLTHTVPTHTLTLYSTLQLLSAYMYVHSSHGAVCTVPCSCRVHGLHGGWIGLGPLPE